MQRLPITVLIPTYNCAQTIGDTLRSACWADEIFVVDSYSTDGTLDICRQFDARIIQHEYTTPAKQKNWAIPQCRHEWILQLDSDEALEPGLYEEIAQALYDYQTTEFGGWPWASIEPVHDRSMGRFALHADGKVEHRDRADQPAGNVGDSDA